MKLLSLLVVLSLTASQTVLDVFKDNFEKNLARNYVFASKASSEVTFLNEEPDLDASHRVVDIDSMSIQEIKVSLLAAKATKAERIVSVSENSESNSNLMESYIVMFEAAGKKKFVKGVIPTKDYMNFGVFCEIKEECANKLDSLVNEDKPQETFLQVKETKETKPKTESFSVEELVKIKNLLRFGKRNKIITKINEAKGELSIEELIPKKKPEIEKKYLDNSFSELQVYF